MYYFRVAAIALLLSLLAVLPSWAGKRKTPKSTPAATEVSRLDRIALAVDGAESSHGVDPAMWRVDPTGPEGPMQVSEAAASDVGGGDRFDLDQNRQIGRAYLAQLYRRYRDWPDAIVAYNWGIGKFDAWVKAGRPVDGLIPGVAAYLGRVLHDSGLCRETSTVPTRPMAPSAPGCADLGAWPGLIGNGQFATGAVLTLFYSQLDRALHLAMEHADPR
jgi:Transglycosylase SLT domain